VVCQDCRRNDTLEKWGGRGGTLCAGILPLGEYRQSSSRISQNTPPDPTMAPSIINHDPCVIPHQHPLQLCQHSTLSPPLSIRGCATGCPYLVSRCYRHQATCSTGLEAFFQAISCDETTVQHTIPIHKPLLRVLCHSPIHYFVHLEDEEDGMSNDQTRAQPYAAYFM